MQYMTWKGAEGSELRIAKIAIGSTMRMEMLSTAEKHRLYDAYRELGGNCIDTARYYGGGHSEEMVGEYLRSRSCRNEVIISTKGGHPGDDAPDKGRGGREALMADLEKSLSVLGTDYVDIYWVHKDDLSRPVEEIVDTCNLMLKQGKARIIGASNFTDDRLEAARTYAVENGLQPFMGSQVQWSLPATEDRFFAQYGSLVMTPERYRYYMDRGMFVFAFSAQAQGFFARMAAGGRESIPDFLWEQFGSEENLVRLARVQEYAKEHGCSVSAPGLAYLMNNRLPCVPIIGAESVEMLKQSMEAAELAMTADEADALFQV